MGGEVNQGELRGISQLISFRTRLVACPPHRIVIQGGNIRNFLGGKRKRRQIFSPIRSWISDEQDRVLFCYWVLVWTQQSKRRRDLDGRLFDPVTIVWCEKRFQVHAIEAAIGD